MDRILDAPKISLTPSVTYSNGGLANAHPKSLAEHAANMPLDELQRHQGVTWKHLGQRYGTGIANMDRFKSSQQSPYPPNQSQGIDGSLGQRLRSCFGQLAGRLTWPGSY